MYENPIFVTGVYRSGTTLPVKILDAHSQVALTHDSVNFFRYYAADPQWTHEPERLVRDAAERIFKRFSISSPVDDIVAELNSSGSQPGFGQIFHVFMKHTFAKGDDSIRWGEKSLLQWNNIPLFLSLYPKGQVIHILRDPRDVLVSFKAFTHEPGNRYLDVLFACLGSFNWIIRNEHLYPSDRYVWTRYEDLTASPLEWTKGMCAFLEIPFEQQMLDVSSFKGHDNSPWKGNSSFVSEQAEISNKGVGRWRSSLSKAELLLADTLLGSLLEKFGYEPSGLNYSVQDVKDMWALVKSSSLISERFSHWLKTGEGTDKYPSDPTNPANWAENNKT